MIELYSQQAIRLYCADAIRFMDAWADDPDGFPFDALITDPPYSSGGMFRGDRTADTRAKYASSDSETADASGSFAGDNRDQRSFTHWCAWWLGMAIRCVKPGGYCAVFTDWRQIGAMVDAVQMGGWIYRGIVPWDKGSTARPIGGRFASTCEYAVIASHGPMQVDMNPGANCPVGIVRENLVHSTRRVHLTEKPIPVMRHLLSLVPPGGTVIDPFAGSATTALACAELGLGCICLELDPHVASVAATRLRDAQAQLFNL